MNYKHVLSAILIFASFCVASCKNNTPKQCVNCKDSVSVVTPGEDTVLNPVDSSGDVTRPPVEK